jgi:hypothetical protein
MKQGQVLLRGSFRHGFTGTLIRIPMILYGIMIIIPFFFMGFYWKVRGLCQKRNAGLTYPILAAVFWGTYTAIPPCFPCFKSTEEVISLNVVEYRLRFPLDVRHVSKC